MHEIDNERLSAFLDGELPPADASELEGHLRGCAECARALERLKAASSAFQARGAEKLPARIAEAAVAEGESERGHSGALKVAVALAAVLLVVFVAGVAFKHIMPGFFGQIQQMIQGAAGSLGPSGH